MSSHALPSILVSQLQLAKNGRAHVETLEDRNMGRDQGLASDAVLGGDAGDAPLAHLAAFVQRCLPWVSEIDGLPRGMRVLECGYLERAHPLHPAGTAFVTVGVDSWDAARALRAALAPIAHLDDASWDLDWESGNGAFRRIQLFPNPDLRGS